MISCTGDKFQQARRLGWYAFQILSHSFELMNRSRTRPDWIVVKRFEKLCRFLAENRNRYRTSWFSELKPEEIPLDLQAAPLKSNLLRTACRYGEQLTRRLFR